MNNGNINMIGRRSRGSRRKKNVSLVKDREIF